MKSLSAGCRGLGELLGFGKISWEAPRSKCIYALDLMAGIRLGSEDRETAISPDPLVSETPSNPLQREHNLSLESDIWDEDGFFDRPKGNVDFKIDLPKAEMAQIDMDDAKDLERRIEAISCLPLDPVLNAQQIC